jgi:hypothetical protein
MQAENEESESREKPVGPPVTESLFRKWQATRRGTEPVEDMTNPVWEWLFRGRIDPYQANARFKDSRSKRSSDVDFPSAPRWAGCRMGQSCTRLADGRVFWIAGEHEDYYDPDFYIYNDVIVEYPNGGLQIVGYPTAVFPPTDFHSATAIAGDAAIIVVGSIGYPDDRREGYTPVHCLDTESLQISQVASSGENPSWIHKHEATLSEDGRELLIQGGTVLWENRLIENIDQWTLRLTDFHWTRLTKRAWPRFQVARADGKMLHLWRYCLLPSPLACSQKAFDERAKLAAELGAEPDLETFQSLHSPSIAHRPVAKESNEDGDWREKRITVDGVCIRFVDELDSVAVTVEGDLPKTQIDWIAEELSQKLSRVENAPCVVNWIGGVT